MTAFDFAAGAVLVLSALMGFVRGATREISTVVSLLASAIVAVFALRFTAPWARTVVHIGWLADCLAVLGVFVIVYCLLRLMAGVLVQGVRQTGLSGLDRLLGGAIGGVRALVILGLAMMLIEAATPADRMPGWISDAKLYPLAAAAGGAIRAFAPKGLEMARTVAPTVSGALSRKSGRRDTEGDGPTHRPHGADPMEDDR